MKEQICRKCKNFVVMDTFHVCHPQPSVRVLKNTGNNTSNKGFLVTSSVPKYIDLLKNSESILPALSDYNIQDEDERFCFILTELMKYIPKSQKLTLWKDIVTMVSQE